MQGRVREAEKVYAEFEPLEGLCDPNALLISLLANRQCHWGLGNLDLALHYARRSLKVCEESGLPWLGLFEGLVAVALLFQGRWEEARESASRASSRLPPVGTIWAGGETAYAFLLAAHLNNPEARGYWERIRPALPESARFCRGGAKDALLLSVEPLAMLGLRREAFELYARVAAEALAGDHRFTGAGLIDKTAGIAAAAGDQFEVAARHFEKALRFAHEHDLRTEQAEVRRWYARTLLDRNGPGDHYRAHVLLTAALQIYSEIGMPRHVERIDAMLSESRK
jgi:tetratricopeptide (TPR) repeat protein